MTAAWPPPGWDGRTLDWTLYPLPANTGTLAFAFGNGRFVALTANVTYTSVDGKTWTAHPGQNFTGLHSVAFGGGVFLAVLEKHTPPISPTDPYGVGQATIFQTVTSPDGITWTSRGQVSFFGVFGSSPVASVNGQFVLMADTYASTVYQGSWSYGPGDYTRRVSLSADGAGWTTQVVTGVTGNSSWYVTGMLAYGNGVYVWVTNELIYTSTDLLSWAVTPPHTDNPFTASYGGGCTSLIFAQGLFVSGKNTWDLATSPDGVTWTGVVVNTRSIILAWGDNLFIGVSANQGNVGLWLSSDDARTWGGGSALNTSYSRVAFGNHVFVGIDGPGTHAIVSSPHIPVIIVPPDPGSGSGSSSAMPPQRYLRMMQRDDNLGIVKAPRLTVPGATNPSSKQSKTPRIGNNNTYR